jgi:VWFA-related protein
MPRRAAALLLAFLAPLTKDAPAQQQTFRVQSKVVQVPVVVTDKEGRNIDGLRARDFTVLDNGVPQEVTLDDFAAGLPPISLVVAVQSSQTSQLALADIRRIGAMIQPLVTGQRGEVAVVAFDHDIQWLQDFTRNEDKIHDAIKSLRTGAATGARIFDTIAEAADRMRPRQGRKMLLLISQSNDSGSRSKFQEAVEAVEREGIEVFAAHYSSYAMSWIARSEDFPEKPILDQMFYAELARIGSINHVRALALATGGSDYSFARQQGIDKAIGQLGAEVHSQYILSFPQRQEDTLGMHQIEVSLPARGDLRIRARQAYWVSAP